MSPKSVMVLIDFDTSDESDDFLNFDKMYKKMSVIYSKLINPTCGKFKDFTDFLKKFAYLDLPLVSAIEVPVKGETKIFYKQ